jgi:hypothetical protein
MHTKSESETLKRRDHSKDLEYLKEVVFEVLTTAGMKMAVFWVVAT